MLLTPHILFALYIAKYYPPWIALPVALLSHFAFDFFVPHWNPHIFTQKKQYGRVLNSSIAIITGDALLSLTFIIYQCVQVWPDTITALTFILAAFLSILPDIIEIPYYFFNCCNSYMKKIMQFQHDHQASGNFLWGNVTQWALAFLCVWMLLR